MGSRGSVIPLFINQIKSKNDITITNPDMTRFMMSLDNAVDLVEYAFDNGIKTLDTAKVYGSAHSIIGEFHINNPDKKPIT